jgi:hypothetical protein
MTGKRRAEPLPREGQHIPFVKPGQGEDDPRARKVKDRRPGPRHARPDDTEATPRPPRKRAPRKAAPISSAPASSVPVTAPLFDRSAEHAAERTRRLAAEGHEYAVRQAIRATGGRPSVSGRALSGGAAGAATGATIGSLVAPGPGTAVGAAAGGGVGAVAGGVSGASAKKAYMAMMRTSPGAHRALVAEFGICMAVVALSPLTDRRKEEPPGRVMKRLAAILGVFFILGLVSAGGRSLARVAAGFGALVTVALLVSDRDLFTRVTAIFASSSDAVPAGTGPDQSVGVAAFSGGTAAMRRAK